MSESLAHGLGIEHCFDASRATLARRLRAAIDHALTDRQRQAIEWHFFEGLSQSEIARRLGISQQVVHKRIYGVDRRGKRIGGALARLRRALAHSERTTG